MRLWLYLLTRKEGHDSNLGGYDQYDGFVVCAESPFKAREICYRHTGTNILSEEFRSQDAESEWKNPNDTTLAVIGVPSGSITAPQVILSDYHPG